MMTKTDPRLVGEHNAANASGALRAALLAGADQTAAGAGIAEFGGAERRMQVLREGEIVVIDDYAHHPTEIEATLRAVRGSRPGRIIAVFQPHLYSRTAHLISEFAEALSLADQVVITDIYPAREDPIPGVSSARIAEASQKPCHYVPSRHLLPETLAKLVVPGDVVVAMGAGNIAEFGPAFVKLLDRQADPKRKTSVAVLYGGDSAEREVSNVSGRGVSKALAAKGYDVRLLDASDMLLGKGDLSPLTSDRPDAVVLAVHGTNAEDGAIQGLCELLHLPYSGSGIQASALAMDKDRTKQIYTMNGLPVAKGELLTSRDQVPTLKAPVVVKPNAQGSTVGLSFVESDADLPRAIEFAFGYDSAVIVEEWIVGMEISVPVLGDRALPVVEIVPRTGRYDFASKYLEGATEEIVPAGISPEMTARVQEYALRAHHSLGCSGATRTDMLIRGDDVFLLETNTLPGMTPSSLLPNSAKAAGISYEDLVDWIVQDALVRHGAKT